MTSTTRTILIDRGVIAVTTSSFGQAEQNERCGSIPNSDTWQLSLNALTKYSYAKVAGGRFLLYYLAPVRRRFVRPKQLWVERFWQYIDTGLSTKTNQRHRIRGDRFTGNAPVTKSFAELVEGIHLTGQTHLIAGGRFR